LLIDDNDMFRELVRAMLLGTGYELLEAADGKAGLACYRPGQIAVVITDILMPEMDGLETIRALRRIDPGVRIIATSGAGQAGSGYLSIAVKLGARRSLIKPFSRDELLTAFREVLAT